MKTYGPGAIHDHIFVDICSTTELLVHIGQPTDLARLELVIMPFVGIGSTIGQVDFVVI